MMSYFESACYRRFAVMMLPDLFSVDHKIASFFGISGDVADRHGQFDTQMGFYRGRDNGVVAEDLLFFVGV